MKIAFVFSGQGAQYPGMLQDIYTESAAGRKVMDLADQTIGRSITRLCFEGTQEELDQTHNTQPCVLASDLAAAAALEENKIHPDGVAGFSLGEYAAFVQGGVIKIEDVFPLIQIRADAMQEAVPEKEGAMAAIIGLSSDKVEGLCQQVTDDYVIAANFNSPLQTVVSGTATGVNKVLEISRQLEIKAIPLSASAPFHCALMKPAAKRLEKALETIKFSESTVPIYMNYTARLFPGMEKGKEWLLKQVYHPVLWTQTIETMYQDGFDTFIECGPGKTLTGFIKKILKGKKVNVCRVENRKTLQETLVKLKG